jgi:adenylate cyclase class 2
MREIEIKARVADKAALVAMLARQNIRLNAPVTQRDQVFGVAGEDGGGNNSRPWLRIRTEISDGVMRQIFTLKKSITNQMDSIEHETEITDETELEKIILHLGFMPYSDLTKTRQKAQIGDVEICVDTVEKLGDFIEAEKLTDENSDYDAVAQELWTLLEQFGVVRDDHVTDGYDVLMRKYDGLDA